MMLYISLHVCCCNSSNSKLAVWVHAARPFLKYNIVTETKFTAPHAMAETHSRSVLCGCETFDIVPKKSYNL